MARSQSANSSRWTYRWLLLGLFVLTVGMLFLPTFFVVDDALRFPQNTVFEYVKNWITNPDTLFLPSWLVYPLFGAVAALFICTVVIFFVKNTRKAFLTAAILSTCFLSAFAAVIRYHMVWEFVLSLYAAPTLLALVNAVFLLVGAGIGKGVGVKKPLMLVFAALSAFGMGYTVFSIAGEGISGMGLHVFGGNDLPLFFKFQGASNTVSHILAYGFTALLVIVTVNYFVSVATIGTKNSVFGLIACAIQILLSIALFVICMLTVNQFDAFKVYGLFAVLAFGIAGLVTACIPFKAVAENEAEQTAVDVDAAQLVMEGVLPAEQVAQPVPEAAPEAEPVEAAEPEAEAQITIDEVPEAEQPIEEAEIVPEAEPVVEIAEEPTVYTQQPVYEQPYQQPAYTAPQQPVYEQPYQQPAYTAPQQPVYEQPYQQPAYAPYAMPVPSPQGGHDFFYASLTPQEKQQFDDLFIHCVLGENNRLPRYVVGGNNTEFFRKVFIFIGRYRAYISSSLLEKLYAHASRV